MNTLTEKVKRILDSPHRVTCNDPSMLKERLKEAIEAKKMSQSALARAAHCHPSAINKILSGEIKSLSGVLLLNVAESLGISSRWLETGEGQKHPRLTITQAEHEVMITYRLLDKNNQESWLDIGKTLLAAQHREPVIKPKSSAKSHTE